MTIAGKQVNIAVASGLAGAGELLRNISSGKKHYDFVEVMACAGGCVNGTGMPPCTVTSEQKEEIVAKRAQGLRKSDGKKSVRKSHENPAIIDLYANFLGEVGSPVAHKLLHIEHNTK